MTNRFKLPGTLCVAVLLVFTLGCASGTVTTVYGPRPAAEVQAQDLVGDILQSLDVGYTAACEAHDALVATEDPAIHAAHRATLIKEHDALVAAWNVLIAWKQVAGSTYSPAGVIQPLVNATPAFLQLAVDLKVMTQTTATQITTYIQTLFPATGLTAKKPVTHRIHSTSKAPVISPVLPPSLPLPRS